MKSRLEEMKGDPTFRQTVHAVRGAASVLSGRAVTPEETELLVSLALAAYANAAGLNELSLSRLARFSAIREPEESSESLSKH